MLVSAIWQSESAINKYSPLPVEPPTWPPPALEVSTAPSWVLVLGSSLPLAVLQTVVCTWQSQSPSSRPNPHLMFTWPFSTSPLYSCPANSFICNIFLDYTIWCRNSTTEHIPWENHNSKIFMHPSTHCSTLYSSQDMEPPTHPSTDKGDVVHIYNGILLGC